MPFKSKKQASYLFSHAPDVAREFAAKTPSFKNLPNKLASARKALKPKKR